jgi:Glycosyl hydrolase family 30 beta sandwich domain
VRCDLDDQQPLKVSLNELNQLVEKKSKRCVSFVGDAREPGALLELATCAKMNPPDYQVFSKTNEGEVKSDVDGLCVTAGWPMLTGSAFVTPAGKKVVLIMNEAVMDSDIILQDNNLGNVKFGINGNSMQTMVY